MADVKWIKITTDIFDDEKILLIESLPDADSIIVIWFKLLCLAGKMNNSGVFVMNNRLPYTDKMLATIFRRKETTVQMALQTFEEFGMIEIIDGVITIPNWGKHQNLEQLEARRQYQKEYQREYRKKQKLLTEPDSENDDKCLRKHLHKHLHEHNVNSPDKNKKEIRIDKDNNNVQNAPSKSEVDNLFEYLWSLYPNKKGKGQVSYANKRKLYSVGQEEMERAIDRYKAELAKDADWRKPQNGSTFFNSGYVDYLDGNYEPQNTTNSNIDESMDDLDDLF